MEPSLERFMQVENERDEARRVARQWYRRALKAEKRHDALLNVHSREYGRMFGWLTDGNKERRELRARIAELEAQLERANDTVSRVPEVEQEVRNQIPNIIADYETKIRAMQTKVAEVSAREGQLINEAKKSKDMAENWRYRYLEILARLKRLQKKYEELGDD